MATYLQFDSSWRSDAYIQVPGSNPPVWVPNDDYTNAALPPYNIYQNNKGLIQTPTNYRVFYNEIDNANNIRTLRFLKHCKEKPEFLNFAVELCSLTLPSNAVVPRLDDNGDRIYISILDEPYLFLRVMPINHAEGSSIASNNPNANEATFMITVGRIQLGGTQSPVVLDPIPRPAPAANLSTPLWLHYTSCMLQTMRLDIEVEEWQIRIYDRYGNDVIVAEPDNGGAGYTGDVSPAPDSGLQTMVMLGFKPNYM